MYSLILPTQTPHRFGATIMLRNTRQPALLLIAAAALFASSCEENAKSALSPPRASSVEVAKNEDKKTDDKKAQDPDDSEPAGEKNPALLDPAKATPKAPDTFQAKFTTTKGEFVIEVTRDWAPNGADRFYNLVKIGYLNNVAFFRNIEGFMVQFGINGDPAVNKKWKVS